MTMPDEIIYLASPYSHPDPAVREARFEAACKAAAGILREGGIVFSPIAHSHHIAKYGLPPELGFWLRIDRAILAHCSAVHVLMLPGWRESKGVEAEIMEAERLGIPVEYMEAEP